jgi:hypothetical protein
MRLGSSRFERRFGDVFRSIFRDTIPRRSSFCHQDWDFVLVAGLFSLSRSDDDPLHVASQFEALHRATHYAMLGGSKTFMSIFVEACGGYAELRRRFVNHLSFDPLPDWPSLPDDVKEGVLADIGWDSRTNPTQ